MGWFWYRIGRLTASYWGRLALYVIPIGGIYLTAWMFEPSVVVPRYMWLTLAALPLAAARKRAELGVAQGVLGAYAGSRFKWAFTEPSFENWVLLALPLAVSLTALYLWTKQDRQKNKLGWLVWPDGREQPILFAPVRRKGVRWIVFAIGDEIELFEGQQCRFSLPGGPKTLKMAVAVRTDGQRVFVRTLDSVR